MHIRRQIDPSQPPPPASPSMREHQSNRASQEKREHQQQRAAADPQAVMRGILELLQQHNVSGPAGAGALTGVLALSLIKAGCSKEKALEIFAGYWDAIAAQKERLHEQHGTD
jgi:hypothetical protein